MKKTLPLLLAIIGLSPVVQALAAEESPPDIPLKTGEYRICRGTEAECLGGKGALGDESFRLEKDDTARFFLKDKGGDEFLWRVRGDAVTLSPLDEEKKPIVLDIRGDGALLLDKAKGAAYLLVEDENTIFRPGMYFQCPENTQTSCLEAEVPFLESYFGQENAARDYLLFLSGQAARVCPNNKPDCDEYTWKRLEDGGLEVVDASGNIFLRLDVDRNMLIDTRTGARLLRVMSEPVLRSFYKGPLP